MVVMCLMQDPSLPTSMSPDAQSFVLGLLTKNPAKRLGNESSQAIRAHPFFRYARTTRPSATS